MKGSIHLDQSLCRAIDTGLVSFFCMWSSSFPNTTYRRCYLFFSSVCFFCLCQMSDWNNPKFSGYKQPDHGIWSYDICLYLVSMTLSLMGSPLQLRLHFPPIPFLAFHSAKPQLVFLACMASASVPWGRIIHYEVQMVVWNAMLVLSTTVSLCRLWRNNPQKIVP